MRVFGPIIGGFLFDIGAKLPFYFAIVLYIVINIIALTQIKGSIDLSFDEFGTPIRSKYLEIPQMD